VRKLASLRRVFAIQILGIKKNVSESKMSLIEALTTTSLFIDGGANIGKISKLAIQESKNPNLEIMAFEPDPVAFAELSLIRGEKFQAYEKALFTRTSHTYAGFNMNIPDQFRMNQFESELPIDLPDIPTFIY
jgi:hypothetical protein